MGYITNLSSNRTPTVQACNEAYGFDVDSMSGGGITLGPHDSNRFVIGVYQEKPVDLRTILKDTDPVDCVYAFIIVNVEIRVPIWLYRESDGTFRPHGTYHYLSHNESYLIGQKIYTQVDTIEMVSIYLANDKYTISAKRP